MLLLLQLPVSIEPDGMLLQEVAQECLPYRVALRAIRMVPLIGGAELQPLRNPEELIDFFRPVEVAPTFEIVGIAAAVFGLTPADEQKSARRGQGQQFVMVTLKSGTDDVRVQQTLDGAAQFGDGVIRRVNVVELMLPVQVSRRKPVGAAVYPDVRIHRHRSEERR